MCVCTKTNANFTINNFQPSLNVKKFIFSFDIYVVEDKQQKNNNNSSWRKFVSSCFVENVIDKPAILGSVWSAENVNDDTNMWKLDSFVLFTFSFQIFTDKLRIREHLDEHRIGIVSSLPKAPLKCFTRQDDSASDACSREPHSTVGRTHSHFYIFLVSSAKRWMLSSYSFSSTFSRYGHKIRWSLKS